MALSISLAEYHQPYPNCQTKTEAMSTNSDWSELTHECLTNIFFRLTHEHLWTGPLFVSKSWSRACKDPYLHSIFDLESKFKSMNDSSIWWRPEFERKVDIMVRSVVNWGGEGVKEIRVRHCSDFAIGLVAERCPHLRALSIVSCPNVTDTTMTKLSSGCPMLKELDISYCYEITYKSLELIGKSFPNLKILRRNLLNWLDPSEHVGIVPNEYLNACPQDGDREAFAFGKFMPQLQQLELRFSKLTSHGIFSISQGCPKLEHLDLFGCANITSRDVEMVASKLELKKLVKPNFYIPRSVFHTERYGHWQLYDERFQTNVFQI